ncbi:hypothetical protein OROMI_008782 [Orobanche minor]
MATPDELFAKAKEYMGNGNTAMEERESTKRPWRRFRRLCIPATHRFSRNVQKLT